MCGIGKRKRKGMIRKMMKMLKRKRKGENLNIK